MNAKVVVAFACLVLQVSAGVCSCSRDKPKGKTQDTQQNNNQPASQSQMSLQEKFNQAIESVKNLKETPADGDRWELYALEKQATVGDVNTARPGTDFEGKAKWDAWNHKKGTKSENAKQDYVNKVQELVGKAGASNNKSNSNS